MPPILALTSWWRGVRPRRRHLRADLMAGLPGGITSVPDGMASSVLAGVPPVQGLYASMFGPVAGGLTQSTRMMIVSTTSAAALAAGSVLTGVEPDLRPDAMLWLTIITGGLLVSAALIDIGRYVRFVSYSVMLGFIAGVGVNMVVGQVPDLTGTTTEGGVAVRQGWFVLTHPGEIHLPTALCGVGAVGAMALLARTRWDAFGSLVALVVPTVLVHLLIEHGGDGVTLVKDGGALPTGIPLPGLPSLDAFGPALVAGAVAVAVIVVIQGAGVAEALPNPDGSRSSTRADVSAQGFGNLASGFLGGQVVGGSVGQSALNAAAGARTRWAAVFCGLWVLAIVVLLAGVVGEIVMATLAAVLMYAGWLTIHPREMLAVVRAGTIPAVAMIGTFVATLLLPVAQAVAVGAVLSLVLQLRRESMDLRLVRLDIDEHGRMREQPLPAEVRPGDTVVVDVYGSLFFSGSRTLQRLLPPVVASPATTGTDRSDRPGPVVVLRLRGRMTVGATFLKVVGDYAHRLEAAGGHLYLSGVDHALATDLREDLAERLADVRIFEATPVLGESSRAAVDWGRTHRIAPTASPDSPRGGAS